MKKETPKTYRLNQYIAKSGITSRRKADLLIESGKIKINGHIIKELGTQVLLDDIVEYRDKKIEIEKYRYIILNKPKGFITTIKDKRNRKTVMDLVVKSCEERIFPIGRLDKNTTGVLLFTNDGDLSQKLIHPKNKIEKLYHVTLDKQIKYQDHTKIQKGIILSDGKIKIDNIKILDNTEQKELLVELHSGKNRIVRRIFEFFDYKVIKLDRIIFAGLSKKKIPRGKWRYLTNKEIGFLKMR